MLQDMREYSDTASKYVYANNMEADHNSGDYIFTDPNPDICRRLLQLSKDTDKDNVTTRGVIEDILVSILKDNNTVSDYMLDILAQTNSQDGGSGTSAYSHVGFSSFIDTVTVLYTRLMTPTTTSCTTGNAFDVLNDVLSNGSLTMNRNCSSIVEASEMSTSSNKVLTTATQVCEVVSNTVNDMPVIDVHTHLLPPSHGGLMLWGVNELLTYHYLVAEFLLVAPKHVQYDA